MLEDIQIKDFALIDSVSLDFNRGFTVLTGETGAGKSILIGALSFLLGGKGGTEVIRSGAHEARVSGTFLLERNQKEARMWLDEHSIDIEDDRVLIRRVIKDTGKTAAWIQGCPITRADLTEFTAFLVDIHGQHEHQSLMYPQYHRGFLDAYADLQKEVESFGTLYTNLVQKRKELAELDTSDAERERKIDMLTFAVDEISKAKLKPGEDEELAVEESRLGQYEKLYGDLEESVDCLSSGTTDVVTQLKHALSALSHATSIDGTLHSLSERLDSAFYEVSDIADELKSYKNGLVFDPSRLAFVQERNELFFKLKKKYAASVQSPITEVIAYCSDAEKQIALLENAGETRDELAGQVSALEKQVFAAAKSISQKRTEAAKKMAAEVESVLKKLGMPNTVFSVSVTPKDGTDLLQKCGPYGIDNVEFLISANPGSPLKPLARIASGGELSRVMLALKTVLVHTDGADTMVFDEIDTGIGGEIAVAIGSHIQSLAQKKQILCITHLASIAVYADTQMKIEKTVDNNSTSTNVRCIENEERVQEIARMLSGDAGSSASLEHARQLLQAHHR